MKIHTVSGKLDHSFMSLVNYSVAPRRQELFLDPKLETDKGRLPIKVVKAATEELQFPTGKKKIYSKPANLTLTQIESPISDFHSEACI